MTSAPLTATRSTIGPDPVAPHPALVTPQWLRDHLDDPAVLPLELDVSPRAYTEWHIPGAALIDAYADLKDPDYRPVPDGDVERLMRRCGIGPSTTVVCYGYAPALGHWLLTCLGHPDVRILDCSRDTWQQEGFPTSTATPSPRPAPPASVAPRAGLRADRARVRAAIGAAGTTLLDVRSAAEYQGERFWPSGGMDPEGRAGHIPTAVHQPVDGLLDPRGAFRPSAELRRLLPVAADTAEADADADAADRELITYCTIGARAATAWFVLTHLLGRDKVRVYDGSWAEWGRLPDTPVI